MQQASDYGLYFAASGHWTVSLNRPADVFSCSNPNAIATHPGLMFVSVGCKTENIGHFHLLTDKRALIMSSLDFNSGAGIGIDTAATSFDAQAAVSTTSRRDQITVYSNYDHETLRKDGRLYIALTPAADVGRPLRGGPMEEMLAALKEGMAQAA